MDSNNKKIVKTFVVKMILSVAFFIFVIYFVMNMLPEESSQLSEETTSISQTTYGTF